MIEEDIIKWVVDELKMELFKNTNTYPCLYSTYKNITEHEGLLILHCTKRGNSYSNNYNVISVCLSVVNDKIRMVYNSKNIEIQYLELADPNIVKNVLTNLEKNLRVLNNGSL